MNYYLINLDAHTLKDHKYRYILDQLKGMRTNFRNFLSEFSSLKRNAPKTPKSSPGNPVFSNVSANLLKTNRPPRRY